MSRPDPSISDAQAGNLPGDGACWADDSFWSVIGRNVPSPLIIVDGAGCILAANAALLRLSGQNQADLTGQSATTLFTDWSVEPFPPSLKTLKLRCRDGRLIPMESAWTSLPAAPTDQPQTVHVGVLRDLSHRLDCQANLNRAEEKLEALASTLPGMLFQRVMTEDGMIRYPYFSEAGRTLLGIGPDGMDVNGIGSLNAIHRADREDHLLAVRRSAARLEPCSTEFRIVTSDGQIRWLNEGSRPRRLPDGGVQWDGMMLDVTSHKHAEQALRDAQALLSEVTANMPGILFQRMLRPDGTITYPFIGDGVRDLFGMEASQIMVDGSIMLQAIDSCMRDSFIQQINSSARTLEPIETDLLITGPNGHAIWARSRSRPRHLSDGTVVWEGVILDVTDRKKAEDEVLFLAYHDPLTKCANRALLTDKFNEAAARDDGGLLAMISIGIDRFSIINTTLGHNFGDQLLVTLAERLDCCLSQGDILARLGGDRFMLMLNGHNDTAEIMITVEQILTRLQDPISIGEEELEITASAGVAIYPIDAANADALIKNADSALLSAKSSGPGSCLRFVPDMNAGVIRTMSMQNRLRRALEQEEFVPFFQPQVELGSGRVVGMEALVRWMSPTGMVSPADFIPVAEESGLIDGICEQMLHRCCQQMRHWKDAGLPVHRVAVNISGRQFQQPKRLLHLVETALRDSGLPANMLELELTESSAMTDPDSAIALVRRLRDRGLSCSIDDFGTGYSSLSVLKGFPISKLKIDRSFVMDIDKDPNDAAIVRAIIAMSHALNLKVVAEGVETTEHLSFLRELGCDQIQGYLFSRPIPAQDMGEMLKQGRMLDL